ncbi:MAG TPA: MMPL family transporter [Anaeromyxobacteraceae bacterium]|nr:MMPL family transporter [Anaeromyxobacteraceae bacterium]
MTAANDRATRVLARIVRARAPILVLYALLVPFAAMVGARIPSEGAIDRLIVPSDPDYAATRAFQRIFPEVQTALLVFESEDPWSPQAIARLDAAEAALRGVPRVGAFSILDVLRRSRPGAGTAELRRLALGTEFFRRQGLVGDRFLTVMVNLDVRNPAERDRALADVDTGLARAGVGSVRKIGAPFVTSWLEQQSSSASARSFPIFGVLLVAIALFLYRSWRALLALVLALGAAVALGVAVGALLGFSFTIVSVLVPLTLLVTTLASLVYLHSRFVDQPPDVPLHEHHLQALRNKLLPVTASTLAAALGFAALAVSRIRPIRELGIWTAIGLVVGWVVAFTLFPALQLALRTPTGRSVPVRHLLYDRLAHALPAVTYRHRWALAGGALAACAAGLVALFGAPGLVRGLSVGVDTLAYLDPSTALYRDLAWFRANVMDLNVARVWIHLPRASATEPEVLRQVDRFQTAIEAAPDVTGATGPTTPLRLRRYLAGNGEVLPQDPEAFERAAADLEQLLLTEPDLRGFIDVKGLADVQLTVLFRNGDAAGYAAMSGRVAAAWDAVRAGAPALEGAQMRVVGESLLQVKVGASLVPTLAESFSLTVVMIFAVFLVLFRSGVERLLAMIPSIFALLATFLGMRLLGGSLNVATIIIATTVLGTTENDQIHFFHHMHERADAGLEDRIRHALRVSGRSIVYATLINAAGFLGLAVSSFPPIRQFGLMTSAAFLLALLADFTALPASLWLVSRQRPEARPPPPG